MLGPLSWVTKYVLSTSDWHGLHISVSLTNERNARKYMNNNDDEYMTIEK